MNFKKIRKLIKDKKGKYSSDLVPYFHNPRNINIYAYFNIKIFILIINYKFEKSSFTRLIFFLFIKNVFFKSKNYSKTFNFYFIINNVNVNQCCFYNRKKITKIFMHEL